jgi:hypothetical protein
MPTKKVAQTLVNVIDSPRLQTILDRTKPIQPVIDELMSHWSYDLYTRKPGAAYTEDGVFTGTDLDLACFLFALAERGAVINIPKYTSRRPKQETQGEIITSADNRHGKILGVTANKEIFSFSIRINDANVMTTDTVGNFRNFMIVDIDGTWYDGWKTIEFVPSAKENDFLTNNKLWTGNSVVFKNFIHPNRWISFYGQHYYATKVLLDRLTEEASFLKAMAADMRAKGIVIGGNGGEKKEWPKKTVVGDQKSIKIKVMEAEAEYPEFVGDYPKDALTMLPEYTGSTPSELLKAVENRSRNLTYSIIPKLRFPVRATECAFFLHGDNGNKMPTWIENAKWDKDFVVAGKKKVWNRIVFTRGVALRYRNFEKSEVVAADVD